MTVERLLSVDADMTIEIGDDRVSVRGDGSRVVVEVSDVSMAFRMTRNFGPTQVVKRRLNEFANVLSRVGLTMVFQTPRRKLLTVGQEGNSWMLKLLGVPNARVHLS